MTPIPETAPNAPLLGCIADDFTGATDLASMLVRGGMRTVQLIDVPRDAEPIAADALVVALKSRTIPAEEAIAQSLAALAWLQAQGCRQFYFKYCSTFDSTPAGNIGPVAEALMKALGTDFAIACPAFPENGRTVYRGYLFVADALLSESGMEKHPLTPMTDPNLVRVLAAQSTLPVGLLRYDAIAAGEQATREATAKLRAQGVGLAIADAVSNDDLHALGRAFADAPLLTGGSGLAIGLPDNFRRTGLLGAGEQAAQLPAVGGRAVVLAGSSSRASQAQVAHWRASRPALRINPLALAAGEPVVEAALAFFDQHPDQTVLIYATAAPDELGAIQAQLGVERAGQLVEGALATIARELAQRGVHRFVVAGGETSGAVVQALGVSRLRIGAPIDPGVPWTLGDSAQGHIALALKSGNFGGTDFFTRALALQS
ncbi:3-oxo-tetronate kinase [Paraburkholderia sp. J63]|uniref:3-oxo-tetronate kinase n=1 Tax=Paraburkholderia sp. J63 TaxID=2805434 RepID=UPI002ABDAF34|nr:3-oxo-tetronate kinase [Paraburkholderia sp. J63]